MLLPKPDSACTGSTAYMMMGATCALRTDESKYNPDCAGLCSPYMLPVEDFEVVMAQMQEVADSAMAKIAVNANRVRMGWMSKKEQVDSPSTLSFPLTSTFTTTHAPTAILT